MEIEVKCESPKYAIGEYRFGKFEELFHWLIHIKRLNKGRIGRILYVLAKNGYYTGGTARFFVDIHSDFKKDYFLINSLARKVRLLKTRKSGDSFSNDETISLQFAKELDNLSKGRVS